MPLTRSRSELLALAAFVAMTAAWGSTFFMIRDILTRVPVFDLLAVRFAIGGAVLALVAWRRLAVSRRLLVSGALLGLLYGGAQIMQTAGLAHTSASASGFITGLYVVATPLLSALILRVRVGGTIWLAVGLATFGLGVLSLNGLSVGYGELLTLASAIVYASHIIALGRISEPGNALALSTIQMLVIAVVCAVAAPFPAAEWGLFPAAEGGLAITLPSGAHDWAVMLYLALVAGALAMLLQTWAQARVEPTRAAVIMAMEPVWAAGFAVALGGERITLRMVIGGLAILGAMYLVELVPRRRASNKEPVS